SYRKMAKEVVDLLTEQNCKTDDILLLGSKGFVKDLENFLAEKYSIGIDISKHLVGSYGDKAEDVLKINRNRRISEKYPYIESEIIYAIRKEYACKPMDIVARRIRLAFLDVEESKNVLPKIVGVMEKELGWDEPKSN